MSTITASSFKAPAAPDQLLDIAERFGTPTYIYEENIIRRQCQLLKRHLTGLKTRLLYAMKANSHPAILEIIRSEGIGIDAVSPGELYLALQSGFSPEDILYTANNLTDEEMLAIADEGVLFNLGELSRLERYGKAFPGASVCVRLNPQVGSGHHHHVITAGKRTKFGVPVEHVEQISEIAARHRLRIIGLHQHIGSGIPSMQVLGQAIEVLLDTADHFDNLEFVNIGGGFNVPYRPEDVPIDFENFESQIVTRLKAHHNSTKRNALTYWFEPGRFFVAEAGSLLVCANTIKAANDRVFAGTDSGMGHLVRPTVYGAYHEIYNLSNPEGLRQPYEVVGNICESGDVFAHQRPIQQIREGDILAILDAGAYGMAMSSVYNLRPRPAEVLLKTDGEAVCIQDRLSNRELVDRLYGSYLTH